MGVRENPATYTVLVDEPEGKDSRLFVDSNANGDLTDDATLTWTKQPSQQTPNLNPHMGGATIDLKYGGQTVPVHLGM